MNKAAGRQGRPRRRVIRELSEGTGGSASPKDLETMFQLHYLKFTGSAPRRRGVSGLASYQDRGLAREPGGLAGVRLQQDLLGDDEPANTRGACV